MGAFRIAEDKEKQRALFAHGFKKDYILGLLSFIDWVLALPKPLELQYTQAIDQIEEEQKMQYVTSFERFATERGLKKAWNKA